MRVKLGKDDYFLYAGKINLESLNNGIFFHLEYPDTSRWNEFVAMRIYSGRNNSPEQDLSTVYFDRTGIYVDNLKICLFVESGKWKPLNEKQEPGTIFIRSDPPVADVYMDGEFIGKTHVSLMKIKSGIHLIRFVKGGKELIEETTFIPGRNPDKFVTLH